MTATRRVPCSRPATSRIGSPGMAARELSGVLDFFASLLVGSIIAENFQKRLQASLREYLNSLCCSSCRAIVKR